MTACRDAASSTSAAVDALVTAIEGSASPADVVLKGVMLLGAGIDLIGAFDGLAAPISAAAPNLPGITQAQIDAFTDHLEDKLRDLFMADHLGLVPGVGATLTLLGLIERVSHAGTPDDPTSPPFTSRTLHFERIVPLLSNPAGHLKSVYRWGEADFDGVALFGALEEVLTQLGLPARFVPATGGQPARLELFAVDLSVDSSQAPPSLAIDVVMPIGGDLDVPLSLPHPAWSAQLHFDGSLATHTTGTLTPPLSLRIAPPGGAQFQGQVAISVAGQAAEPFVVLAIAAATRLEARSIDASFGLAFTWDSMAGEARAEPLGRVNLKGGRLLVDTSDSDGFLTSVVGDSLDAGVELGIEWSPSRGFSFDGFATFNLDIPVSVTVGPISIPSLHFSVGFDDGNADLSLTLSASAQLGPVAVVVDRIGASGALSFPSSGGNLGPADFALGFKFPTGIGIAVNAGPVHGGGFISFEPDLGRYSGALELSIYDISVKAFGLIETKVPGVSFSFVIVISAEFTPIQLGFGFTLNGVGGLVGINRTVNSNELGSWCGKGGRRTCCSRRT